MMQLSHLCKIVLCTVFLALAGKPALAGIEPYERSLTGRIRQGDTLVLQDEKFRNPAYNWSLVQNLSVDNNITFGLHRYGAPIPRKNFRVKLDLKVEYWSQPGQEEPFIEDNVILEIAYDTSNLVVYQAENAYQFKNGHKVKITVNSITSAELGSEIPDIFQLVSKVTVERTYLRDPDQSVLPGDEVLFLTPSYNESEGMPTQQGVSMMSSIVFENSGPGEILARWTLPSSNFYDFDWTFIEAESPLGIKMETTVPTNEELTAFFRNNFTRVTLTNANQYPITLVHQAKYLLARVRMVNLNSSGERVEEDWSAAKYVLLPNAWHEPGKNWQYNATYVEEGKKKEVVTYADGTLRTRQTVTLANPGLAQMEESRFAVVQETLYDQFGRAAVQILPAPLRQQTQLKYYGGLHLNSSGQPYNYRNFYGADLPCNFEPEVMVAPAATPGLGAAGYYSANNTFGADNINFKAIPQAGGYPFSVTRFTPDNTGRVSEQGGVGAQFQPGQRSTKYYYGKPNQWELDRIFGNDVGFAHHYMKKMVQDPNGQVSISYENAGGKVIATALAGGAPANLDSLSGKPAARNIQQVILSPAQFTFDPARNTLTGSTNYMSTTPDQALEVSYNIEQLVEQYSSGALQICSNCYYTLKVTITDDCGNVQHVTSDVVGSKLSDCNINGAKTDTIPYTAAYVGVHYIRFEMGLSEDVIGAFTDDFIRRNTDLDTQFDFILRELSRLNFKDCLADCLTCANTIGEKTVFKARIVQQLELQGVDTLAFASQINTWAGGLYDALSAHCGLLQGTCSESPCEEYAREMRLDVSPGGQYALFAPDHSPLEPTLNIISRFWRVQFPILPDTDSIYRTVLLEIDGKVTSPHDNSFTLDMLVTYWQPEWADRFLEYHPEFCKLEWCNGNATYAKWDVRLQEEIISASQISRLQTGLSYSATVADWLLAADPYFKTGAPGAGDYTAFRNKLMNYTQGRVDNTPVKGLSQYVDYMLYCSNAGGNTNNGATAWQDCTPEPTCRIPDREWTLYKLKYLELKEEFYKVKRDASCGTKCLPGTPVTIGSRTCPDGGMFRLSDGGENGMNRVIQIRYEGDVSGYSQINLYVQYFSEGSLVNTTWIFTPGATTSRTVPSSVQVRDIRILRTSCTLSTVTSPPCDGTSYVLQLTSGGKIKDGYEFTDTSGSSILRFVIEKGYPDQEPDMDYYCAGATSTFYNCLKVTIDGSTGTHSFFNVWLIRCPPMGGAFMEQAIIPEEAVQLQVEALSTLSDTECGGFTVSDFNIWTTNAEEGGDFQVFAEYINPNKEIQPGIIVRLHVWAHWRLTKTVVGSLDFTSVNQNDILTTGYVHWEDGKEIISYSKTLECYNAPIDTCSILVGKTPRFGKETIAAPSANVAELTSQALSTIKSQMAKACEDNAETWILSMEDCLADTTSASTYATKRAALKAAFIEICQLGGDIDHPFGASTAMPGKQTSQGYKSFGDAIKGVLGISAYTMNCNPWVVNGPAPYGVKTQATKTTVSTTTPAICKKLADLKAIHNGAGNFHAWLVDRFGAAAVGSAAQTAMLEKGCASCMFLLEKDIELPVYLEAGAKGYVDRTAYNAAKSDFNLLISGGAVTSHPNYGLMLASYLNHKWGFTMGYEEYAAYEATSVTKPGLLLANEPAFGTVPDDPLSCIMSLVNDAVNQGNFLYAEYIREQKKLFRQRYIETCSATKATVQMNAPEQIYHYTLYYYNLAGQLIRTVPPEGVRVLSDAEILQVGEARANYQPDNCAYAGPVTEGVKSRVNTSLKSLIDNGGALEYWLHQPRSGPIQTVHTTEGSPRYILTTCLNGNRLSLDVYRMVPATVGSAVSVELSRHTTVDISAAGATGPWYHVLVQGSSLFANNLTVYVNGVLCPNVTTAASGRCEWDMVYNGTAWVYPENFSNIRHVRFYSTQRSGVEVDKLAKNRCLATDEQGGARTGWYAFGITGESEQYPGSSLKAKVYPEHLMPTSYAYNTLGQVVRQQSPDAGESQFWYDYLGRLIISQNDEQKAPGDGSLARRSYTTYEALGRIEEVGAVTAGTTTLAPSKPFLTASEVAVVMTGGVKLDVTRTYYDVSPDLAGSLPLTHLRKRVAASSFSADGTTEDQVTFYAYDLMGNVKTQWQRIKGLTDEVTGPKKIEYDYDLASGKVNKVRYQGTTAHDRFMHEYKYDAENRLTEVWAGTRFKASTLWELDNAKKLATYYYYPHGPLARMEMGDKVQGVDYAYTLQGWLKGVNSQFLDPANDLGGDGIGNRSTFARDAFGYSLGYYPGDYNAVSSAFTSFNLNFANGTADHGKPLYNGNISTMTVGLDKFTTGKHVGYAYGYDQLNRLKRMRQQLLTASSWVPGAAESPYSEDITYDGNGNIQQFNRNGVGTTGKPLSMDRLEYSYLVVDGKPTNKLASVLDTEGTEEYTSDLKGVHDYKYDKIGNLRAETWMEGGASKTQEVTWNTMGKIAGITAADGSLIQYGYDAAGNRVYKIHTVNGVPKTTWYVRDAQGNTMAVYSKEGPSGGVMWDEQPLYGSSRLGIWKPGLNLTTATSTNNPWLDANNKHFELSNHLGNVLTVINDGKAIVSQQDYYTFGSPMPGRYGLDQAGVQALDIEGSKYRYGFNGKENDNEVGKGEGGQQDYGMRIYDPRIAKFLSVDPITAHYPMLTPYQFASNSPLQGADVDGLELINRNNDPRVLRSISGLTAIGIATGIEIELGTSMAVNAAGRLVVGEVIASEVATGAAGGAASTAGLTVLLTLWPQSMANPERTGGTFWKYQVRSELHRQLNPAERIVSDPSVLSDDYLMGVRDRLMSGTPLLNDHKYQAEAVRRGVMRASGWEKRLGTYERNSPNWASGSFKEALDKFAPGAEGVLSDDGVKVKYFNTEKNIEILYDNENNYFRIKDNNKGQYVGMDGKVPKTGTLKGAEAKDHVQQMTHIKNTD